MLLVILCTGAACAGLFTYYYTSSQTFHDTVKAVMTHADTPSQAFPNQNEINVLLMGRDLDRDPHGRVLHTTRGRTDAIMLAHIDFRNNRVNILSIPRDTLVRVPGYRGKRRINSANALGGPELAQDTVADFLGVTPDYYALLDFDAFVKTIDGIGGLRLTVDKQLDYDDSWGNLHIHLTPGNQQLNGTQAMGFVRYRHANGGGGDSDLVRISRQQELLAAFKAKMSNPVVLLKFPHILDKVRGDLQGNLSMNQLVCLARFLKSVPPGTGVKMATVPDTGKSRVYVKPDTDATKELVDSMFHSAHYLH